MARLLVIQHVPHEGLGTFAEAFKQAGCSLPTVDAYDPRAAWPQLRGIDAIVSMGGPMGVAQQATYPFLKNELALLREALDAKRPILGICLGAQLLAHVLGAPVTTNPQKEIGWYPLMREPDAEDDPLFEPFGQTETVFQWHGDTFALPKGAVHLASSPLCEQQAFRYGDRAYGLQFHVEVTAAMIRSWLRANAMEMASLKGQVDPATIRRQASQHLDRLKELARHIATIFATLVKQRALGGRTSRRALHA